MRNFAITLLAALTSAEHLSKHDVEFMRFIAKHSRNYDSVEEYTWRKIQFTAKDQVYEQLNATLTTS